MYRIVLLFLLATAMIAGDATVPSDVTPVGASAPASTPASTPGSAETPASNTTTSQDKKAPEGGSLLGMLPMLVIFILIFYFLILRPQRKEDRRRKDLVAAIKAGNSVVTIGGLHGEVVSVGEQTVDLRVGKSERESIIMTYNKSAIAANLTAETGAKS
jgi:preprotein translocase subunit YajC